MTSLRNRLAALLILAIVTVVGLATFAASIALQPPRLDNRADLIASQIRLLVSFVETNRKEAVAAGAAISDMPASGEIDRMMTEQLSRTLSLDRGARNIIVTRSDMTPVMIASVDLESGDWLQLTFSDQRPPPGGWKTLAIWIILIILGSAGVSIFAALKIIRPLQLLEGAVGRIGTDGILPYIPETGSDEVRVTAHALNRLSARLRFAMESRMRLVAAAGHDLRTPMTRMRLRAEFIATDEERQKWLADLEELDSIADSAIRLVREEATQDLREVVRLDRLVHEIVDELYQLDYDVTLSSVTPQSVAAGPLALKRGLRNLIINAATHGKGAIVGLGGQGNEAVVTIVDKGPGIPEELLGQVFEPFFRVDAARRKSVPGAGLGLAIAKEIIERFGGSITIVNRKPSGLSQMVKLPLAAATMQS